MEELTARSPELETRPSELRCVRWKKSTTSSWSAWIRPGERHKPPRAWRTPHRKCWYLKKLFGFSATQQNFMKWVGCFRTDRNYNVVKGAAAICTKRTNRKVSGSDTNMSPDCCDDNDIFVQGLGKSCLPPVDFFLFRLLSCLFVPKRNKYCLYFLRSSLADVRNISIRRCSQESKVIR